MARNVLTMEAEGLTRAERRALQRTMRELRTVEDEEAVSDEQLPAVVPFAGGRALGVSGGSYWSVLPVSQPAHQSTSHTLAAIFPMQATPPIPAVGPVLGIDARSGGEFSFDPWEWYAEGWISSTNILIAGGYRQGKSFFVKMLVCRSILFGRQGICTSDPKNEHARIALAVGGHVIKLGAAGGTHRLNILDGGVRRTGSSDVEYEALVAARRGRGLEAMTDLLLPARQSTTVEEHTALDWALQREITETKDRPTIRGIWQRLSTVTATDVGYYDGLKDDAKRIVHALRRVVSGDLAGMFDGHSTVTLDPTSPYTVFDTSEMMHRGPTAMALSQLVTNSWVQSAIADKTSGRKYFVLAEEGWAEMNSVASLEALRLRMKLSGEYGICNIMLVHEGGDFSAVGPEGSQERSLAEVLVRSFANKATFRQEPGQLKTTAEIVGFTPEDVEDIKTLEKGMALFKVKDHAYRIDTMPVSSDWERELFNTDAAMDLDSTPGLARVLDGGEPSPSPTSTAQQADALVVRNDTAPTSSCALCEAPDQMSRFCTSCGAPQSTHPAVTPAPLAAIAECDQCGSPDQHSRFCTMCGTPMPHRQDSAA